MAPNRIISALSYTLLAAAMLLLPQLGRTQLRADFTADKTAGCVPLQVSFSNRTSGASASAVYKWDLGNGNSSAIAGPGAVYNEEKSYTVTLTVTDNGQTSVKTQTITVHPPPKADFTISSPKACLPAGITFTSTSQAGGGTITNYHWDFGDGETQQGYGPSATHTYRQEQESPVSLTVTNNFGCSHTIVMDKAVKILPAIGASFSASQEVLCVETDPVTFTGNAFGPGTLSYEWDFGDGSRSTMQSPSHSFNKKGIYTVKFTVKSSEGCQAVQERSNYLNVAQYSANFTVPPLICSGVTATITSSASPSPNNTRWEVNGTEVYSYYNTLNYTFPAEGDYTIKLTNTFGSCPLSITKTVQVKRSPRADNFTSDIAGLCGAPTNVTFKDPSTDVVKWEWDFDYNYYSPEVQATGKEATRNFSTNGYKNIWLRVTTADGCTASASKSINLSVPQIDVAPKDIVSETGNMATCEKPVELTFYSPQASQIAAYSWQFSDGTTSTDAEPRKKFTTIGDHWGRLSYTTKNGCKGSLTLGSIRIYGTPTADFISSTRETCGPTPVTLTASGSQHAESWQWDFGDNTVYYSHSFQKSYTKEGIYDVTLTVRNARCQASITKPQHITVNAPFSVISSRTNTCDDNRDIVTFQHGSSTATEVLWDFGDNSAQVRKPATETAISHKYPATGNYTVTLTAIKGSCSIKTSTGISVLKKQKPTLTALQNEVCIGTTAQVTSSNLEDNPATDYYYGNEYMIRFVNEDYTEFKGTVSSEDYYWKTVYKGRLGGFPDNPSRIKAILTSYVFGCMDTTNTIAISMKGATSAFSVVEDNKCWNDGMVALQDESTHFGNTAIVSRTWNFGDGSSYTTDKKEMVRHAYNTPGEYHISLQVKDAGGCTHTTNAYTDYARVKGPKAQFSLSSGNSVNQNAYVYFYNNTQHSGSYDVTYKWYINNNLVSTDYWAENRFVEAGNYTIRLEASSAITGCSSSYAQQLEVKPFNYAFSFSTTLIGGRNCPPALVRFQNTSVNYTKVEWDFGDGFKLGNTNYPSHIYEKPGKYYVKLFVYGPNGLTGEFKDSVVLGAPTATIAANSLEGCKDHTVELKATSDNATSYVWDFGDGNTGSSSSLTGSHIYRTPGKYLPSVTAVDKNGCMSSVSLSDAIIIRPDPAISISSAKTRLCLGESVQLSATGADTYEWIPSGSLNVNTGAVVTAKPVIHTSYLVKGMDDIGCSGNTTISLEVVQPQKLTVTPDAFICLGDEVRLNASGADRIVWINETSGLSNAAIPDPVARPAKTTTYTVQGKDRYNCFTDEVPVKVTVHPLPTVRAGNDTEVLAGSSIQLNATSSSDVVSWNWAPASYLDCINCEDPVAKPLSDISYILTVTNANGCQAKDTTAIKLLCEANRIYIPNGFTPNGDGHNDLFMIKGIGIVKHMVIFSRWGDKVFERSGFIASEPANAWNGYINGNAAPPGTYVYFIEMECPGGQPFTKKGTVTLMR